MTIAMAGVAVSMGNWLGLAMVFALFLPSEIYRAMLEEQALHDRFGEAWDQYASKTRFFVGMHSILFALHL